MPKMHNYVTSTLEQLEITVLYFMDMLYIIIIIIIIIIMSMIGTIFHFCKKRYIKYCTAMM